MARPTPIIVPGGLSTSKNETKVAIDPTALIEFFRERNARKRQAAEADALTRMLFGPGEREQLPDVPLEHPAPSGETGEQLPSSDLSSLLGNDEQQAPNQEIANQAVGNDVLSMLGGSGKLTPSATPQLGEFTPGATEEQKQGVRALHRTSSGQSILAKAAGQQLGLTSTSNLQDPALIRSFEITRGEQLKEAGIKRGTKGYEDSLIDWRENVYGGYTTIGRDPESGNLLRMGRFTNGIEEVDASDNIVSVQKPRTPAGDLKDLAMADGIIERLGMIKEIAKNNPDKIGPLEGRWNTIRTQFVEDEDGVLLKRGVKSLIQQAYVLSGKTISAEEMKMLSQFILPSINLPDANFMTSLGFAEQMLLRDRENRERRLGDNDYYIKPTDNKKEPFQKAPKKQSKPSFDDRLKSLMDGGTDKDKAFDILLEEGY